MISGNPYKFAVLSGVINEWNLDDTFGNGVLLICINGDIYPKEIVTATLRCEIEYLRQKLRNLTTDKRLYVLSPQQAFAEIYDITFPEDTQNDNNDCFNITPAALSDCNCFVFAVRDEINIRILASKLTYETENSRHKLENISISETFLTAGELEEVTAGLERMQQPEM